MKKTIAVLASVLFILGMFVISCQQKETAQQNEPASQEHQTSGYGEKAPAETQQKEQTSGYGQKAPGYGLQVPGYGGKTPAGEQQSPGYGTK